MSKSNTATPGLLPEDRLSRAVGYLEGEIKTLLEGSISDPEQRRALKSLAGRTIWAWSNQWQQFILDQKMVSSTDSKTVHKE